MTTPFIEYTHTDGTNSKFEFSNSTTREDYQKFHIVKNPVLYGEFTDENGAKLKLEFNESTTYKEVMDFYETHIKPHETFLSS